MKRAQMEIMGLAIVVILLVLGMTFVLRFMLNQDPIDYKQQFLQAEIASNMLNTYLKTTADNCNGLSMTELLQDCGHAGSIYCEGGESSCTYAEQTAATVFGSTLEKWNLQYEFMVFRSEEDPFFSLGEACPRNKKSKTFPLPTSSGTLFVKLDVCG